MNNSFADIDPVYIDYAQKYLERFMPISRTELLDLLQYCEIRRFDKRKIIVHAGEVDIYLNLVVKGLIRKYLSVRKDEIILQLATEGHVVQSEISFLTKTPSMVILETLEPTILVSITYDKMEEALNKFPKGERLGRMILQGMFIKKDENRYNRLLKSTRERFFDYIEHHPHMLQRIPQKYLASYLQIKPETFSRLKALMAKHKK
jgi:CRP-like cAMP-binding protein